MSDSKDVLKMDKELHACKAGLKWVEDNVQKTPKELWESCEYGHYLLWHAVNLNVSKTLVLMTGLKCALMALELEKQLFSSKFDKMYEIIDNVLCCISEYEYDDISQEQIEVLLNGVPRATNMILVQAFKDRKTSITSGIVNVLRGLIDIRNVTTGIYLIERFTDLRFSNLVRQEIKHDMIVKLREKCEYKNNKRFKLVSKRLEYQVGSDLDINDWLDEKGE